MVVRVSWGHGSAKMYLGTGDPKDPGFAPLHGSVDGFPPTLVQVGRREVLHDQDIAFAKKLEEAGVQSKLTVFPRLWHVGHAQSAVLEESRRATAELADFLAAHL